MLCGRRLTSKRPSRVPVLLLLICVIGSALAVRLRQGFAEPHVASFLSFTVTAAQQPPAASTLAATAPATEELAAATAPPTVTPRASPTPTHIATATPTLTATPTHTPTPTASASPTSAATPTIPPTDTPTTAPTATPTATATRQPTATEEPTPNAPELVASPQAEPDASPASPTPEPTATATAPAEGCLRLRYFLGVEATLTITRHDVIWATTLLVAANSEQTVCLPAGTYTYTISPLPPERDQNGQFVFKGGEALEIVISR